MTPTRTRGGQPGNSNALKHGRYSAVKQAERLARWKAEQAERRARWPDVKIDYAAICDAIDKGEGTNK